MNNFTYIIFDKTEESKLDLNVLLLFSAEPIRPSNDEIHSYVKYIGDMPACIKDLTTKSSEYKYEQIKNIFVNEHWINNPPF
jgi:hypothetical protein